MKKTLLLALTLSICTALSGCGAMVDMPELSEEQTELVTEYAAGLMLKYDTKYSSKLMTEEDLEKEEAKEEEERAKQEAYKEAAAAYLAKKEIADNKAKEEKESSSSEGSSSGVSSNPSIDNIASFYGIDGFSVSYSGYEICDSYPHSGSDMLMAMEATPGKSLLVLKFNVANTSGGSANFDMFYRSPNFYVSVDGGKNIHNQATLLLDDMAAFAGEMSAGDSKEMVLIFEVDESIASVGSMTLTANNNGEKGTMVL